MSRTDLINAFMLLTRLPVGRFSRPGGRPDFGRCVWAFPLVGSIVNGIGGLVYWLAHGAGVPPLVAAAWTLAATISLTGGLHEDGLADTADGFGGGTTRTRKLEIMRDSRIGSYGALALLLSVTGRVAAIAALDKPHLVMTAMVLAGMFGRAGILLLLLALAPARDDGMGASIGKPKATTAAVGLGIAIVAAWLTLPALPSIAVVGLGLGSSLVLATLAATQIGGHTGDVLGASEVVTECVVLTVVCSAFST